MDGRRKCGWKSTATQNGNAPWYNVLAELVKVIMIIGDMQFIWIIRSVEAIGGIAVIETKFERLRIEH